MTTNAQGKVIELVDYYPYGEVRLEEKKEGYENDYLFTGQERDEETGLMYYGARYYEAKVGRFMAVDPWEGDLTDPQTLNKYAYVLNNPLKYTDPTGKSGEEVFNWALRVAGVLALADSPVVGPGDAAAGAVMATGTAVATVIKIYDAVNPMDAQRIETRVQETSQVMERPFAEPTAPPIYNPNPTPVINNTQVPSNNAQNTIVVNPLINQVPVIGEGINEANWFGYYTRGRERIRDTGLRAFSDEEIKAGARDKNITSKERQRYIKEEKARELRNQEKRKKGK